MKNLSARDIHKRYGVEIRTIQKHFKDGKIQGKKDINGDWSTSENIAEESYKRPKFPDWQPIEYYIKFSSYSKKEIMDAIDEGILDVIQNLSGVFIHFFKWKKNMLGMRCPKELFEKIKPRVYVTVINESGIHVRPTSIIGRILMKHPRTKVFMKYNDKYYRLNGKTFAHVLPELEIGKGEKLLFKAKDSYTKESQLVLNKIARAFNNGFWMDKDAPIESLLDI